MGLSFDNHRFSAPSTEATVFQRNNASVGMSLTVPRESTALKLTIKSDTSPHLSKKRVRQIMKGELGLRFNRIPVRTLVS